MKFGVIIAARYGSSRLRGKAMLPIAGIPAITYLMRRIKDAQHVSEMIFATTSKTEDDIIAATALEEGLKVFRGSENDVLNRYVEAARPYDLDYVVRVTGDCPFLNAETLDGVIEQCQQLHPFDLVTTKPAFPSGIDYEVYRKTLLEEVDLGKPSKEEREHILNYIYKNEAQYKIHRLTPPDSLRCKENGIFLLDTPEDYSRVQKMATSLYITPEELISNIQD